MIGRPHKILDAAEMEKWFNLNYFEIYDEWECDSLYEYPNLWDFVCENYSDEMDEFEDWFHRNRAVSHE